MSNITPFLWFEKDMNSALSLYEKVFDLEIEGLKEKDELNQLVSFDFAGITFTVISGGPSAQFTPASSFILVQTSAEMIRRQFTALAEGGKILMALDHYPFSPLYGWVQDQSGLSWQFMLDVDAETNISVEPSLLFSSTACGKAEEALSYYAAVFPNSTVDIIHPYQPGESASPLAKINYGHVNLDGFSLSAMDDGTWGGFVFSDALSLVVGCRNQAEIDYYWERLSADPSGGQCGWTKDKYGLTWQVVPATIGALLYGGTEAENQRVSAAMLGMKKLDIAALVAARDIK